MWRSKYQCTRRAQWEQTVKTRDCAAVTGLRLDMEPPSAGATASFETSDGHKLCYESWGDPQTAAGTPRITVVFLHGVHESADTLVCAADSPRTSQ